MSREWKQVRVRIPHDLYAEIEAAALAKGDRAQSEILTRIRRGSNPRQEAAAHASGVTLGEIEVAKKLVESLGAVLGQMRDHARPASPAPSDFGDEISDDPDAQED